MPYQQPPNPQFCTFGVATSLANRLRDIGVPVGKIYEITEAGRFDTTDSLYFDDGQPHQYVACIWDGPEQNLGTTQDGFNRKGYNWETFTKLGTASGLGESCDEAILELHNIYRAINAALTKQMTE